MNYLFGQSGTKRLRKQAAVLIVIAEISALSGAIGISTARAQGISQPLLNDSLPIPEPTASATKKQKPAAAPSTARSVTPPAYSAKAVSSPPSTAKAVASGSTSPVPTSVQQAPTAHFNPESTKVLSSNASTEPKNEQRKSTTAKQTAAAAIPSDGTWLEEAVPLHDAIPIKPQTTSAKALPPSAAAIQPAVSASHSLSAQTPTTNQPDAAGSPTLRGAIPLNRHSGSSNLETEVTARQPSATSISKQPSTFSAVGPAAGTTTGTAVGTATATAANAIRSANGTGSANATGSATATKSANATGSATAVGSATGTATETANTTATKSAAATNPTPTATINSTPNSDMQPAASGTGTSTETASDSQPPKTPVSSDNQPAPAATAENEAPPTKSVALLTTATTARTPLDTNVPIFIDNDEAAELEETMEVESLPTETEGGKVKVGAKFPIVITSEITSKTANVGDPVQGRLKYDIKIGDRLIATRGSIVRGHVNYALKARTPMRSLVSTERWYRDSGCLGLAFDEIINEKGEHIPLEAEPAREALYVKNKGEGRELGINHKGQIAGPWSQQLRYKAIRIGLNAALAPAGAFSFGAMPVALGVMGAVNPSFAFMKPVGTNVRHRRIKGFMWGALSGVPGSWLIEDTTVKGNEAIIKPGDQFMAELRKEFTGDPAPASQVAADADLHVKAEMVKPPKGKKKKH